MSEPPLTDDRHVIALDDPRYPKGVAALPAAPKRLWVLGDPQELAGPCLAIIGARRATPYGIACAELAARVAAESGVTVVSGAARGCDRAAGAAALEAGGRHIAVLGCGADVVYPKSSARLLRDTIEGAGAVVSLDPWGTPPRRYAFPRRNRVIAALSRAVFVSEAGMPSGTFSTAEAASELGRELLAAPGSIFSPPSRGANYLICCGACCIADEEALEMALSRIFGVLRRGEQRAPERPCDDAVQDRAMRALVASPLRLEELAALLELDVLSCTRFVSTLQIDGLVEQLFDGRYAPTKNYLGARTRFGHNGGDSSDKGAAQHDS
ncbi:SMF family protein [Coriobacterium glomerans PW2]|uniref:SMF family protein n=1 Tax=Coriobacterium glomerans (strain ATCC 49209 / DSM 20642 / JCM 10262 / PW2) TaxID=700015 RepID=F2N9G5_CORGP|nr:DNA-processing protein DprA [Coriobacterium glomerans]AEB06994.1 SMF family protein [Coriobacterium glomerans PW2]